MHYLTSIKHLITTMKVVVRMTNKKVVIYNLKQAAKFIKHGCIPVDWKYKMENDNVKIGLIFEVDELYKELMQKWCDHELE